MDLSDPRDRVVLCEDIASRLEEFCEKEGTKKYRKHLGASGIGEPCSRQLFYNFRWATEEKLAAGLEKSYTPGQMARLLNRGDMEEERAIRWLRACGFKIWDIDPKTEKQFKFSNLGGHFEGSVDSFALLPEEYGIEETILVSYKTMKMERFRELKKSQSIKASKPGYYYQEVTYGYQFGIKYALYYVANKNNDDVYLELVHLDPADGEQMLRKADDIINCDPTQPPLRIAMRATDFHCKYCIHKKTCHYQEPVRRNCRSCIHSRPIENKQWYCLKHNKKIGDELIRLGCEDHEGIQ